ncbi:MAG TPA: hypothetical protein VFZ00_20050 [Solirubrobacter sp.]|nr:hypothetical protein [Solirubrobacter sp.]
MAQLGWRGDDQLGQLVERRGARFDRALTRDAQLADRFNDAVGAFGDHDGVSGLRLAGGHLGIDRVALAAPAARVRVWPVDLDHVDLACAQVTHKPRRIGAGRFDADHRDRPERRQPRQQLPVALGRADERVGPE